MVLLSFFIYFSAHNFTIVSILRQSEYGAGGFSHIQELFSLINFVVHVVKKETKKLSMILLQSWKYRHIQLLNQLFFYPNQILRVSCGFKALVNLHLNVLSIQSIYPESITGSWRQLWVANCDSCHFWWSFRENIPRLADLQRRWLKLKS